MPAGKKKKFIDKKNSVTFYLAHRSQRDPLVTDETAPQRVLVPIEQAGGAAASSYSQPGPSKVDDTVKRKEELTKFGIYFDDDYDYLQHLKDSKEVSNIEWDVCERVYASELSKAKEELPTKSELKDFKLKLPSSVFESEYQEDIGMLNKAAPSHGLRLDLDFDVRRALEDDFDFEDPENVLEDDFIKLANDGDLEIMDDSKITEEDKEGLFSDDDDGDNSEDYSDMDSDDDDNGEGQDKLGNLQRRKYADFDEEETKSRFTNYSMSSSVIRRNEQLTLLDERFEKMYEGYEDTEIGALDCDDIEGFVEPDSEIILQYAKEFEQDKNAEMDLHEKITHLALKQDMEQSDSDDSSEESEEEKEKWDCETIISTYSTTKNRPKMIREASKRNVIKVSGRTGMPLGVLGVGLTKDKLRELDKEYEASRRAEGSADEDDFQIPSKTNGRSIVTASGISSVRGKNETPEERHERKQMVKEYRRERRVERKANKDAFKDEKKRQVKVRLNCVSNVQGLKL